MTQLHITAMDPGPTVPPKDRPLSSAMDVDRQSSAPPSASKRKRESHESFHEDANPSLDEHSPKRSRGHSPQRDEGVSQSSTPTTQRGLLRRKQKVGNLSNLNLRHKAKQQQSLQQKDVPEPRDSKFQEGSLTDKPSARPPSVFTRMISTDSGNLLQVDDLMADYHDGLATPTGSADQAVEQERALMSERVHAINAESNKKDENGGLLRFGRQIVSTFAFHPVNLWNKVWSDTKDDILAKNMEEGERMAMRKAQAEATYAEMKRTGQFKPHSFKVDSSRQLSTPRDSGVVMDGIDRSMSEEQQRHLSAGTVLVHPPPSEHAYSELTDSEVPDSAAKSFKGFASRLHFKRPSLSNLKSDLKRVRSDFNLSTTSQRDSSLSASPHKVDPDSALRMSVSKIDLKKQHKLSKRVSDLELRLQHARQELDDALVEASPVPKLNSKYQRFVASGTSRRPKFMPGQLPTLPSQHVFDPAQLGSNEGDVSVGSEARTHQLLDLATAFGEESEDEDTIKVSRGKHYPARASTLFNMNNNPIEDSIPADGPNNIRHNAHINDQSEENMEEQGPPQTDDAVMEVEMATSVAPSVGATEPAQSASYSSLDAKLKALDAQVKSTNKSKTKKRKSGEKDAPFEYGGSDDPCDDDWEAEKGSAKKKQKRKASSKNTDSPVTKRAKGHRGAPSSPTAKKSSKGTVIKTSQSSPFGTEKVRKHVIAAVEAAPIVDRDMVDADPGENDLPDLTQGRSSLDSQGHALEPLYEAEEETAGVFSTSTITVPLKDPPSHPTAHATPARYSREFVRTRPGSPNKRVGLDDPSVRSKSQSPGKGYNKTTTVITKTTSLGLDAAAPTALAAVKESETADFVWPEDVF